MRMNFSYRKYFPGALDVLYNVQRGYVYMTPYKTVLLYRMG